MTTPLTTPLPIKQKNTLGLIALTVSVIGSVLACIPASIDAGWILLAAAFILGIVGALQSGRTKKGSVAAIVISVLGAVVSAGIIFFSVSSLFIDLFVNLFASIFNDSGQYRG